MKVSHTKAIRLQPSKLPRFIDASKKEHFKFASSEKIVPLRSVKSTSNDPQPPIHFISKGEISLAALVKALNLISFNSGVYSKLIVPEIEAFINTKLTRDVLVIDKELVLSHLCNSKNIDRFPSDWMSVVDLSLDSAQEDKESPDVYIDLFKEAKSQGINVGSINTLSGMLQRVALFKNYRLHRLIQPIMDHYVQDAINNKENMFRPAFRYYREDLTPLFKTQNYTNSSGKEIQSDIKKLVYYQQKDVRGLDYSSGSPETKDFGFGVYSMAFGPVGDPLMLAINPVSISETNRAYVGFKTKVLPKEIDPQDYYQELIDMVGMDLFLKQKIIEVVEQKPQLIRIPQK
ncbi:MAG: hypothetical protein SFT81_00010 [Candidatus Caenarcaniphilales bacterium]|nr:hypothetical protein [Candidatus Caenarcaniphilales bacterium]